MLAVTDVTRLEVIQVQNNFALFASTWRSFGVKSYNRKGRQEFRKERKEFATLGLVSDF
jgi:hypothetical protein